ncbi:MAG: 2Fe-2S iron-sulfur cluster-binding protein [Acidimicrobiales bacterium]
MSVQLRVNGELVSADPAHTTLLELLREQLRIHSVKDGCAPQGQCGCCTVLVDGQPRISCVTPLRRIAGREVTTLEGLPSGVQATWSQAFSDCGASQCGFCSPAIVVRLVAEAAKPDPRPDQALLAHVCRCTGWLPILAAFQQATETPVKLPPSQDPNPDSSPHRPQDPLTGAAARAALESHGPQLVGPTVVLGRGGFAEDLAPADALVAVPDGRGGWAVGESLAEALGTAGKVQGRRSTVEAGLPLPLPEGSWDRTLQTSWVDAAYLETDASWCRPGEEPADPAGNGGDFGAKANSPVARAAHELANRHGRAVRVRFSREDAIRLGAKRPPLAAGIDLSARRLVIHVARTPGVAAALRAGLGSDHGFEVAIHEVDVAGPPTSLAPRCAGWAEGVVLRSALTGDLERVHQPDGGWASARVVTGENGRAMIDAEVGAGDVLAEAVLRSYCTGAVHMALSWVTSERVNVGPDGEPLDLTLRSLGVLRAMDMPAVRIGLDASANGPAVAVSDALFAATAAAVWAHQDRPPQWPTRQPLTPGPVAPQRSEYRR